MIAKDIEYRNRKLLDLAHKINECQVQIPGVCIGWSDHGCEPAHANNWHPVYGKGGSRKAHDCFFSAACRPCHSAIDQGSKLDNEERHHYWQIGHERTLLELFRRGYLKVAA